MSWFWVSNLVYSLYLVTLLTYPCSGSSSIPVPKPASHQSPQTGSTDQCCQLTWDSQCRQLQRLGALHLSNSKSKGVPGPAWHLTCSWSMIEGQGRTCNLPYLAFCWWADERLGQCAGLKGCCARAVHALTALLSDHTPTYSTYSTVMGKEMMIRNLLVYFSLFPPKQICLAEIKVKSHWSTISLLLKWISWAFLMFRCVVLVYFLSKFTFRKENESIFTQRRNIWTSMLFVVIPKSVIKSAPEMIKLTSFNI